ncbi:MAG: hypothetical protein DU429_01005 [Candidatus Tokpelaia sp.]|nr:MAG: hypothetical protein DU430_02635 [Candidatus Tokpelaia sp.]KAA6207659.1 MAG: hypothetical protein DU429_01005 [Candidatus Tokpelaia sp.]
MPACGEDGLRLRRRWEKSNIKVSGPRHKRQSRPAIFAILPVGEARLDSGRRAGAKDCGKKIFFFYNKAGIQISLRQATGVKGR